MDGSRQTSRERVELIQATDSLSTVPPNTVLGFAPSKMSRQPIRVAKPPQPRTQRFSQSEGNSYNDIVRKAEQQRRLIDANRREIELRESRPHRVDNPAVRLSALRNEVLREEREMAHLNSIQREAREMAARRVCAEKQLYDLQNSYSSQQEQLRSAASRIDSLKTQMDLLYRRRLAAMNAARAQQNRLNAQNAQGRIAKTDEAPRPTVANEPVSRPRASVEPFQITRPTVVATADEKRPVDSAQNPQNPAPIPIQNPRTILSPPKDLTDRVAYRKPLLGDQQQARREDSPSPPKDPYPSPINAQDNRPTLLINRPESNISSSVPVANVNNVITANAARVLTPPVIQQQAPATIPTATCSSSPLGGSLNQQRRGANMHSLWNEARVLDEEAAGLGNETNPRKEDESGRVTMADQISIRPDTLRAAKRRSWAQQEAAVDEAEYIRKILCEQQKKGRTHLNLDHHLESFLNQSQPPEATIENTETSDFNEECAETMGMMPSTSAEENSLGEESEVTASEALDETPHDDEPEAEKEYSLEVSSPSESSDSNSSFPEVSSESIKLIKPPPEKGILRAPGTKSSRGRVVFDPLALLLDAALEGEIDAVKASAAKVTDVSASNEEGITALHNGICAGQFEIVKFLVESAADVNAQDSDGWTPLHCAASCNNLPMVKLLVENGACIFAQTLSDLETPMEKCEEDEDGYEGCHIYLQAAHSNAGLINDRKMYTAYAYEAVREDELSFVKGECLRVVERDGDERAWWLCERVSPPSSSLTSRGLVPRNYLSLYPCLGDRPEGFMTFDLTGSMHSRQRDTKIAEPGTHNQFDAEDDLNEENSLLKMDNRMEEQQTALPVS